MDIEDPGKAPEPADRPSFAKGRKTPQARKSKAAAQPVAAVKAADLPAEEPLSMSDAAPHVHAPHGGVHSWRDFFVHIAIITIGLLLAIGLEQTAESIHHARQRAHLEEQMRETLESNSQIIADDLKILADLRAYLVDMQKAVAARRDGQTKPDQPLASDPRTNSYAPPPILGPFQASKANGSVALLSLDRIRLYDRLEFQYDLARDDLRGFIEAQTALNAFRQRFDPSETTTGIAASVLPVDLAPLSADELTAYQALIGDALQATSKFSVRLRRMDVMGRAVLEGARNEEDLLKAITAAKGDKID